MLLNVAAVSRADGLFMPNASVSKPMVYFKSSFRVLDTHLLNRLHSYIRYKVNKS